MRIGCHSSFTNIYVLTLLVNTQCQHLLALPIFCSSAYYQANSVAKSTPSFGFHLAPKNYHLLSPMCNEAGKVAQIACRGQFGQCLKEVFSFHKGVALHGAISKSEIFRSLPFAISISGQSSSFSARTQHTKLTLCQLQVTKLIIEQLD